MPLVKELHGTPLYAVDELMIESGMRGFVIALLRPYAQLAQFPDNPLHGGFLIPIILAAANADKPPTKALQNGLALHVRTNRFLAAVELFSIALYGDLLCPAERNHINPVCADGILLLEMIAAQCEIARNLLFKGRFGFPLNGLEEPLIGVRVLRVFEQILADIACLEVAAAVQRMNDP